MNTYGLEGWLDQCLLFVIAVISNCLSALAGGGAGLIQLPVIIFMGLPFPVALATHKVASVALGIGASLRHFQSSKLQKRLSLLVIGSGVPGVIAGANTILLVPTAWATTALGLLTIAMGIYSYYQPDLGQHYNEKNRDTKGMIYGSLGIFAFGFLNGSLTSGTGLLVTLWLIRWFGFDYKLAIAHTLVLVGLFWNSTGAITLGIQQDIAWAWLPALVIGSLVGGFLGAHFSIIKGNRFIKRVFEITTVAVGIKLLLH
jgi:uncharacterized protein